MQIAFLLYDGFTALDAVRPYEALVQMPDAEPVFVAERAGPTRNDAEPLRIGRLLDHGRTLQQRGGLASRHAWSRLRARA